MNRASLNAARRQREIAEVASGKVVDVLVVGGGITGAGVALDAASRGLSVALLEKHDLAFGTSRWSSKMVHGGLRYLAHGDVAIAHESAVERGILMARTAPHLARPLPIVWPLLPRISPRAATLMRAGLGAGDLLRLTARTGRSALPRSRRLSRVETLRAVPALRSDGLRGGLLSWDGQLEDDARLVVAVARTAAAHGALVLTRCGVEQLTGDGALVQDTMTRTRFEVHARAVINATGVWAGTLVPGVELRPSRGTHLVVHERAFGHLGAAVSVPVPGERNRAVFALPQPGGRVYVGLTDEATDGSVPDVPQPTESEITFLLDVLDAGLETPIRREDVLGAFAGLRPLLAGRTDSTADLSRRHAVLVSADGVVSVIGGKLTTYRRMSEDAVDAAVRRRGLSAGRTRTRDLPVVGAAPADELARVPAPRRLVARYGTEAPLVMAEAGGDPELLGPIAEGVDITGAELLFGLRHEGALDEDDLLDRRTRIGLVPADRERAQRALGSLLAGAARVAVG